MQIRIMLVKGRRPDKILYLGIYSEIIEKREEECCRHEAILGSYPNPFTKEERQFEKYGA